MNEAGGGKGSGRLLSGPRVLAVALLAIYVLFLVWHRGSGTPLTQGEIDAYFAEIAQRVQGSSDASDGRLREELRELVANDGGGEFYMLNLIRFRERALYPPGTNYSSDALKADAIYNRAIAPYLFRHGNYPVFLGAPIARFIRESDDVEWQRVALVRYRSRRDLLEMVVDLAGQDVGIHKWAAIERTHVFPVRPAFSLIFTRGLVAVVLIAIGFGIHLLLRRRAWYAVAR